VTELSDGVMTDAHKRTGYIASNFQFQFDGPPQAGAIFTAGFSHCSNHSLAFGDSTVFWQCRSGEFFNLYDRWWADQCEPVEIAVMPCSPLAVHNDIALGSAIGSTIGSTIVATTVSMSLGNGKEQMVTTTMQVPVCQIEDGEFVPALECGWGF